jgi:hypothetical protein
MESLLHSRCAPPPHAHLRHRLSVFSAPPASAAAAASSSSSSAVRLSLRCGDSRLQALRAGPETETEGSPLDFPEARAEPLSRLSAR